MQITQNLNNLKLFEPNQSVKKLLEVLRYLSERMVKQPAQ